MQEQTLDQVMRADCSIIENINSSDSEDAEILHFAIIVMVFAFIVFLFLVLISRKADVQTKPSTGTKEQSALIQSEFAKERFSDFFLLILVELALQDRAATPPAQNRYSILVDGESKSQSNSKSVKDQEVVANGASPSQSNKI